MSLFFQTRPSDSPLVDTVIHGHTFADGAAVRPGEVSWHMVLVKHDGIRDQSRAGPRATSGIATWGAHAEILWIKFKLGVFMPHLPTGKLLNAETKMPDGSAKSMWLYSSVWEVPNFENVDTFINRLAHDGILVSDPLITSALADEPLDVSPRTLRHRFLHTTGHSQRLIRQMKRAFNASELLEQGMSIADTVFMTGYFDQAHLTRHKSGLSLPLAVPCKTQEFLPTILYSSPRARVFLRGTPLPQKESTSHEHLPRNTQHGTDPHH